MRRRLLLLVLLFAAVSAVAGVAVQRATGRAAARHYWIVSFGDSYTAGNGAGNIYPDDNGCHRSYDAYPWRFVDWLRTHGQSADIWHVACSGAVADNILHAYTNGDGRSMPSQLDEVPASVAAKADIALLTIGGNDVGFSTLIWCLAPDGIEASTCRSGLAAAQVELPGAMAATKAVLLAIAARLPHAQIVLIGYPHLTDPSCPSDPWNATFRSLQSAFDADQAAVVSAANSALDVDRVHFVSTAATFAGRGPCAIFSRGRYVNLIQSPTWASFHPNKAGNQAISDLLVATGVQNWNPVSTPPTTSPTVTSSGGQTSPTTTSPATTTVPGPSAVTTTGPAPTTSTTATTTQPPPQAPPRSVQIGWSSTHPSWIAMTLEGFAAGSYSYTCDFASGGDASFAISIAGSPETFDNGQTCFDSGAGDQVWVTVDGVSSNVLTVAAPAPVPTPSPQPAPPAEQTWAEAVGGPAHTWTDYSDAGGTEGPTIQAFATVQISCRVGGFRVADGNTWWYRVASAPWSDQFYVSADAFYNNGATSGSLHGTPFFDPAVAAC